MMAQLVLLVKKLQGLAKGRGLASGSEHAVYRPADDIEALCPRRLARHRYEKF